MDPPYIRRRVRKDPAYEPYPAPGPKGPGLRALPRRRVRKDPAYNLGRQEARTEAGVEIHRLAQLVDRDVLLVRVRDVDGAGAEQ